MSDFYFEKLPIIEYQDVQVRDISRNVRISNDIMKSPNLFYPYELKAGVRADVLASTYYDDSYLDWMIYHTNGIVDPYYGWYLDERDFQDFIEKKYGSFEAANKYIKNYRVDWTDDTEISVSFYRNNLSDRLRKYYIPNFGYSSTILGYTRKREDWTVNTNKIYNLIVTMSGNTSFQKDEIVSFAANGQGQIISCNSSVVSIHHVSGNIVANSNIVGDISKANASVTDVDLVSDNIPDDEYVYWKPVTWFEWELERNESKKHVYLLDANYSLDVSEGFRKKMKE